METLKVESWMLVIMAPTRSEPTVWDGDPLGETAPSGQWDRSEPTVWDGDLWSALAGAAAPA
jgi:hypothetical protein